MEPKYLSELISEDTDPSPMDLVIRMSLKVLADIIEKHNPELTLHTYKSILSKKRDELLVVRRKYHKYFADDEEDDEDEDNELCDIVFVMPKKGTFREYLAAIAARARRWPEMELWGPSAGSSYSQSKALSKLIKTFKLDDTTTILSIIDQLYQEYLEHP